ncbi:hypothetical protein HGM15179_017268 [Zosterops borbonicus]|uniref:Peptidase S1 domain-containing protein n=1 Tax=Zosterops borbonicus TaxID=364589 RepID=A0A8K1G1E3_9PASS|nr:hypothetical protein HGM15179_017268 [Zosterops borbonicus]
MALLWLLLLLALAGPVGGTWDSCRGTCGLRPMVLNESSAIPEYTSSDSGNSTTLDVNPGTWTGIASIQVTLENGTWHMCSGTLINHRWVLTTARCFTTAGDIQKWKVVLGATDLSQPGREAQVFSIKRIVKHRHYDHDSERNNIALVELQPPVECNNYIQLGCVPDSSLEVSELKTCYMAGWRASPESGECPEAKVRLIDVQLCNSSRWYGGAVHPQDLCAGYPRGGIDTCQGDIGGPLICKDHVGDYFWLVGLASWGKGCTGEKRPGVFTSTQHFRGWIQVQLGLVSSNPAPTPTEPALTPHTTPMLPPSTALTLTVIEGPPSDSSITISFPKHILLRFFQALKDFLEFLRNKMR